MFRDLITVLVGLLALSTAIGGRTKEKITLRVYNYDSTITDVQMKTMLKNTDFAGNGFQKEETRTMVSTGNATNQSAYTTTLYYYKVVDCSRVMQVMKELHKLFPGVPGASVDARLAKEMKDKKVDTMKQCKAGVEIHLKPDQSHDRRSMFGLVKRDKDDKCCCKCCCCCCCCDKVEAVE